MAKERAKVTKEATDAFKVSCKEKEEKEKAKAKFREEAFAAAASKLPPAKRHLAEEFNFFHDYTKKLIDSG